MDSGQYTKQKAAEGKYQGLYSHLSGLQFTEWRTSFSEIESILGFGLPASARRYNAWWANEKGDSRHSQSFAWTAAGWKTADVDMNAETLSFRRLKPSKTPLLDDIWPVRSMGAWPEGLSLRREDMYEDRV
ncbi:MAG: hypothetical protein OXC95_03745 [Dehalococcoidia bacterium]|nr:hypothetical protein [Dehalococcoidia bacterium]